MLVMTASWYQSKMFDRIDLSCLVIQIGSKDYETIVWRHNIQL